MNCKLHRESREYCGDCTTNYWKDRAEKAEAKLKARVPTAAELAEEHGFEEHGHEPHLAVNAITGGYICTRCGRDE